jgi:hypothetical protein
MSVKIKYDANGLKEAEVEIDSDAIQNGNNINEYKAVHDFLIMTGVLGSKPVRVDEDGRVKGAGFPTSDSRQHNKSQPHYKADRRLAKVIIDAGGLKYLHGVQTIDGRQFFFFDREDKVADIIERYVHRNESKPVKKTAKGLPVTEEKAPESAAVVEELPVETIKAEPVEAPAVPTDGGDAV